MPNSVLAMFPGQGSQYESMGSYLIQNFPYCKKIFEEADDILHLPITKLCCESSNSNDLEKTAFQQPSILTTSFAAWSILKRECDFKTSFFAGHSLGEYSALVAAEKLSFHSALKLVHARGKAMQEATPLGSGAMAAVLKYDRSKLVQLCSEVSSNEEDIVEVVNFNSPQQQIISGKTQSVDKLCKLLKTKKVLTIKLKVSAPFHSSLMTPARNKMESVLTNTKIVDNLNNVIPNTTALPTKDYSTKLLIEQINSPVLWEDTLTNSYKEKIKTYIELSPGKVLSGLAHKTLTKDVNILNCMDLPLLIKTLNSQH